MWGMEEMSAGLSMGQLDTLKTVLLDQVARVDEAKVRDNIAGVSCRRRATWLRPETWCQSQSTHAHDAKDFWVWLICAGRQHEKSSFFFFFCVMRVFFLRRSPGGPSSPAATDARERCVAAVGHVAAGAVFWLCAIATRKRDRTGGGKSGNYNRGVVRSLLSPPLTHNQPISEVRVDFHALSVPPTVFSMAPLRYRCSRPSERRSSFCFFCRSPLPLPVRKYHSLLPLA